ncbi:hypothetical protein G6F57_004457 [Rhizopus arrhizus]|nr:hypothetical protein G6F23_001199 [Rhizopus arrhizus]KAG0768601.1 hypothetical protein G6F24_001798 [Rhizopus arrhizus]KAG0816574.1 hypothetical protein G6F20_003096 [Rhizopus arrhizus]KAG0839975.1 hypothetical protein G6F19_002274 [Rhizopus arrhizus]KAG0841734.1 hypothetical protein G6F18_003075 [Rhizopus arrhizus]
MLQNTNESKVKKLWKNRLSGLSSCIRPHQTVERDEDTYHKIQQKQEPPQPIWRKPLPDDCPVFDFDISEKTLIAETPAYIPARYESRQYSKENPNIDNHLKRICNNEKTVLLTKALQEKHLESH